MWHVTTSGDLPDDYAARPRRASAKAWDDYHGRILELEIGGFTRVTARKPPATAAAGSLFRGVERMTVAIERTA